MDIVVKMDRFQILQNLLNVKQTLVYSFIEKEPQLTRPALAPPKSESSGHQGCLFKKTVAGMSNNMPRVYHDTIYADLIENLSINPHVPKYGLWIQYDSQCNATLWLYHKTRTMLLTGRKQLTCVSISGRLIPGPLRGLGMPHPFFYIGDTK